MNLYCEELSWDAEGGEPVKTTAGISVCIANTSICIANTSVMYCEHNNSEQLLRKQVFTLSVLTDLASGVSDLFVHQLFTNCNAWPLQTCVCVFTRN